MNRKHLASALAVALLAVAPLSAGAANLGKDFDVLNNKNIFSKNRTVSHFRPPADLGNGRGGRKQSRTYTPVLIGAMLEDDGYVAFIVDPKSREIVPVRPGDVLPSGAGTLKEITLDYIITDPGSGKPPTRVTIGQNILGGVAEYPDASDDSGSDNQSAGASTQPGTGSSSPGAQPTQSGPPSSSGNVDDIVERLRKRRQQQLNK